jgi:hypothetical protein
MKDLIINKRIVVFALMAVVLLSPMLLSVVEACPSPRTKTIFFDDFNGKSLSSKWTVETTWGAAGAYKVKNGMLTLTTPAATESEIDVYTPFDASSLTHFTVSTRVKASTFSAFSLELYYSSPPCYGNTQGIQFELSNYAPDNKYFVAAWQPNGGGWTWDNFYQPSAQNTWYILEMNVQQSPFTVTWNVYTSTWFGSKGTLLGSYSTTNIGLSYSSIKYIELQTWTGPATYNIDWVKIVS